MWATINTVVDAIGQLAGKGAIYEFTSTGRVDIAVPADSVAPLQQWVEEHRHTLPPHLRVHVTELDQEVENGQIWVHTDITIPRAADHIELKGIESALLMDAMAARPGVLEGLAWGPEPPATQLDEIPADAIRDAAQLARQTFHIDRAEFLEAEYDRRAP